MNSFTKNKQIITVNTYDNNVSKSQNIGVGKKRSKSFIKAIIKDLVNIHYPNNSLLGSDNIRFVPSQVSHINACMMHHIK